MRIGIEVNEFHDLEALEHGCPAAWYRLNIFLRLRFKTEWSNSINAIVDTGSPYSVVPRELAALLLAKPLFRTRLGGLVPGQLMSGTMAEIDCMVTDGRTTSDPFTIRAILADEGGIPLILGIHGLLDKTRLTTVIGHREAWIDP